MYDGKVQQNEFDADLFYISLPSLWHKAQMPGSWTTQALYVTINLLLAGITFNKYPLVCADIHG